MISPSGKKRVVPPSIDPSELQAILLQIPDGILIAEAPSGILLYQNEEAARLLRHPLLHEENYEHYTHGMLHENGHPYRPEEYPLARALRGESVRQEELLYRRGDGTLAYLLVSATPIRNDEGNIVKVLCSFVDTTARRRAEQALKESERRFSLALSGANTAMWHLDVATGDAVIGDQLLTMLGYQPGDIKPSFNLWLSGVHADDKQEALDRWYDHLEGNTPLFEASVRLRTADGGWKWMQMRGQVIDRDAQGKARHAAGMFFDIDRGKRAELALKESEERFCRIFESAAVGIGTITAAGRWLSINPKLAEILGYPKGELPQDGNIKKIVHPDDLARFEEALSALLHNEVRAFSLELRNICRTGATIWADLAVSPVLDPQGGIKDLIVILEDKTARKLAQEQLQNAQVQLRMATQIAHLGFWEWNVRSGETYFSDEWKAQLGYSDEELRDYVRDWEAHIHPDDRERAVAYRNEFLAAPRPYYVQEYRRRHKDGTYRWISVRAIPLYDEHGNLYKLIGTQLDITDQKAAQE
ncbi:MAG TPA: PAS domain-containing protein, partial [Burkholderiaceae bacterium]|nr:PAS domain-containing protein [Burkholderiaceae bacterium]